jgi:hypothetical protein
MSNNVYSRIAVNDESVEMKQVHSMIIILWLFKDRLTLIAFLFCSREVTNSNLGPETGYPD